MTILDLYPPFPRLRCPACGVRVPPGDLAVTAGLRSCGCPAWEPALERYSPAGHCAACGDEPGLAVELPPQGAGEVCWRCIGAPYSTPAGAAPAAPAWRIALQHVGEDGASLVTWATGRTPKAARERGAALLEEHGRRWAEWSEAWERYRRALAYALEQGGDSLAGWEIVAAGGVVRVMADELDPPPVDVAEAFGLPITETPEEAATHRVYTVEIPSELHQPDDSGTRRIYERRATPRGPTAARILGALEFFGGLGGGTSYPARRRLGAFLGLRPPSEAWWAGRPVPPPARRWTTEADLDAG